MTTTPTKTGIEFDASASEVLLVCHDCNGAWRAFAWDRPDAERRAAAHEERCHPGIQNTRGRISDAAAKRRSRGQSG
jgi:hypothetical protein